jgi:ribonuclease HI
MPYYVCSSGPASEDVVLCTSWARAKLASQGKAGGWARRYDARDLAEAELERVKELRRAGAATWLSDVRLESSAVLGQHSRCAVSFGEGDPRNAELELPPPHTLPRAALAALLLALERGADDARLWSDSAYVCQLFEAGFPTSAEHQDLVARARELCCARRIVVCKAAAASSGDRHQERSFAPLHTSRPSLPHPSGDLGRHERPETPAR